MILLCLAFPKFRKLYGKYAGDIEPGTYTVNIRSNYDVKLYDGTKTLIISTVSWIGGKNIFLGTIYIAVGGLCILIGTLFLIKHLISPRYTYLHLFVSFNVY